MELLPIENKIVSVIKTATRNDWQEITSRKRTRVVKGGLVSLGHKLGYKVCTSGRKKLGADMGEWLFDLCWADWNGSWRDLRGLKLITEVEWQTDNDNIIRDFRKLTVGIAEFRLFITTYKAGKRYEKRLQDMVKTCKGACPGSRGFRYMIAAIPDKESSRIKSFAWTA